MACFLLIVMNLTTALVIKDFWTEFDAENSVFFKNKGNRYEKWLERDVDGELIRTKESD